MPVVFRDMHSTAKRQKHTSGSPPVSQLMCAIENEQWGAEDSCTLHVEAARDGGEGDTASPIVPKPCNALDRAIGSVDSGVSVLHGLAASSIQRCWKKYCETRSRKAIIIQAICRGWLVRRCVCTGGVLDAGACAMMLQVHSGANSSSSGFEFSDSDTDPY